MHGPARCRCRSRKRIRTASGTSARSRVFLVVEPGELRREVVSVDAGGVDPLSMNAVVETLDELADAAARLRRHALPRRRLIEPQVIGVLRTGRAGVDRCIPVGGLRNLVLEVARRVLPRVTVDQPFWLPITRNVIGGDVRLVVVSRFPDSVASTTRRRA